MRWAVATIIVALLLLVAVPRIQLEAYKQGAPEWTMGITILVTIWVVFLVTALIGHARKRGTR